MREELNRLMDELTEQPEHHGACPRCGTRYSDWFTTKRDGLHRYCFTCYHGIRASSVKHLTHYVPQRHPDSLFNVLIEALCGLSGGIIAILFLAHC